MNNVDKLTKVLLAVIAVALCMIALNPWLRPIVVEAQRFASSGNTYHITHELMTPGFRGFEVTLKNDK